MITKQSNRGAIIKARASLEGIKMKDVSAKSGIPQRTIHKRIKEPDTMSIFELRQLDKVIRFTNEEILRLAGRCV